jgi:hypothetical protein
MNIENKILVIRGQQVMLDRDLAEIYGYETKNFNRQVKNNIDKFDEDFMFQLTKEETDTLSRCKNFTLNEKDGRGSNIKYLPYAFTEQGIYMLMTVLKGDLAVRQSKALIRLFKKMKQYFANNAEIIQRIDTLEYHKIETDIKLDTLFTLMNKYKIEDKQGVFVQGQIFDAYIAFQNIIQKAQKEIILIDNYIDLTVLERLSKKNPKVLVTICTRPDTPVTNLDVSKFNSQYPTLNIRHTTKIHDRFLIIDNAEIYFIGASVKDLGKKCFAFMQFEDAQWIRTVLNAL